MYSRGPSNVLRGPNRERRPELYWALRGGGKGNFGIVTSFRIKARARSRAASHVEFCYMM